MLTRHVSIIQLLCPEFTAMGYWRNPQGSPTCSICWGKHKVNKYKTESMEEDPKSGSTSTSYGVMTSVLDTMLREKGITMTYLEAPVKENMISERAVKFFEDLDQLFFNPEAHEEVAHPYAEQVESE